MQMPQTFKTLILCLLAFIIALAVHSNSQAAFADPNLKSIHTSATPEAHPLPTPIVLIGMPVTAMKKETADQRSQRLRGYSQVLDEATVDFGHSVSVSSN